ncbi:hypothetical protein SANTM175S_02446 [Streptomyces antimycoticus]
MGVSAAGLIAPTASTGQGISGRRTVPTAALRATDRNFCSVGCQPPQRTSELPSVHSPCRPPFGEPRAEPCPGSCSVRTAAGTDFPPGTTAARTVRVKSQSPLHAGAGWPRPWADSRGTTMLEPKIRWRGRRGHPCAPGRALPVPGMPGVHALALSVSAAPARREPPVTRELPDRSRHRHQPPLNAHVRSVSNLTEVLSTTAFRIRGEAHRDPHDALVAGLSSPSCTRTRSVA